MNHNPKIVEIEEYLSHIKLEEKLDRLNMVFCIYHKIIESENPAECFAYFLANADNIESDDTWLVDAHYTLDELNALKNEFGEFSDAVFEKLLKKNLDEDMFYESLWKGLTNNPLLDTEDSIVFAIYYTLIDARIPYFKLSDGTSMPNAQFAKVSESIQRDIDKARFILRTNRFEQKTSRASVLLDLIDTKSGDERIVLMAHIISFANNSFGVAEGLIEALRQRETLD